MMNSAAHWQNELNHQGVPAGPVLNVTDALSHPQIRDRGMIGKFEKPPGVERDVELVRTAIKINHKPLKVTSPPPRLGEHTQQILADMGFTEAQIKQYRDEGAI